MLYTVLTIIHVFICFFLIVVVLLQAGKGGGMGIAFGGGGSQTVFGSSGAGNFLTKLTATFAVAFFVNSLTLAYLSSRADTGRLQRLSDQKAAATQVQDAQQQKVMTDIEKARQEIEKATGQTTAAPAAATTTEGAAPGTTAAPAAGTTAAPATEAPPAAATPPATEGAVEKPRRQRVRREPATEAAPSAAPTPAPAEPAPAPASP